jgi:hypothetical protein
MIGDPAFHNIYSMYPFVPYVFATAPQRLACPSAATAAPPPTTSAPFHQLMYEVLDLLLRTMCGSRTGGWSLPCVMSD